ncbi:MAG TPA: carboxypeptidase-like regulatory domain-containing protein [Thermoanaerobaculia bacterium]
MTWEARFEGKGLWGEPLTISPQHMGSVRLRVFPTGRIRGTVILPAGEKPLSSLAVRLQPSFEARAEPLDATILCPIEKGTLSCEIPAGKLDLRLRAEGGFAPVYLWGAQILPGKEKGLGDLKLRRGASVSGWVQTAEGRPPSPECRLTLTPSSAVTDELKVGDQIRKAALEVAPNERGFFQILGVSPGRYELIARQPGYAETRISAIDVRPDLESQVIDRLVLGKPVTFDITLDPPVEPYGSPWRIELAQRATSSDPPSSQINGTASQEGVWHVPGLSPGTYELRVLGDQKAIWHEEFLDVRSGQPSLRIDLPVLRVEGRVLIGKEPLAATLWLSQKGGRRLRFDSDDRGRFNGVLPGEGLWGPQIYSEADKVRVSLEPLEIKPPQGKNLAKVEIHVPDTKLSGQVVDDTGQPVRAARVVIAHLDKRSPDQLDTDEKGEFSVRGLLPGSLMVKADDGERQSDFISTSLPKEGEAPWLRLVLRKLQTYEGRVISPAGGVPGAMILAWSAFSAQGAAHTAQAVSGADGSFHVELPASTTTLNLAVFPPGYALRLTTIPVSPGQPVEIPVESQGGTLTLEWTEGGPNPLLVHGGVFVVPGMLKVWEHMQGSRTSTPGRLVLTNVEPGPYNVCLGAAAISRLQQGGEPPAASCTGGFLAPNGTLSLQAPGGAKKSSL